MKKTWTLTTMAAMVAAMAGGCAMWEQAKEGQQVTLAGANEVPAVNTRASGRASIRVDDCMVTVTVTTEEINPTAAHIHEGASGANGGVAVPLNKTGPNTFASAPGAKFTPAQCEAYKKGNTYVNVHSAANPGGEIRGQIAGR